MIYRVTIEMIYRKAHFEFDDVEEACRFMAVAARHTTEGEDKVEISMTVIRSEEEEKAND